MKIINDIIQNNNQVAQVDPGGTLDTILLQSGLGSTYSNIVIDSSTNYSEMSSRDSNWFSYANTSVNGPIIGILDQNTFLSTQFVVANYEVRFDISNANGQVSESKKSGQTTTSSTATASIVSNNFIIDGQMISMKAHLIGKCNLPDRAYSAHLIATFIRYGGTTYQVGTTDIVEKEDFGSGVTSTIETNGTDIKIQVIGDTNTINWSCVYEYIIG